MEGQHRRILFAAEAVTLAHVARPLVLARALDPGRYDVHFACAPAFDFALSGTELTRWPLDSIPPAQFAASLAAGKPLYDLPTLEGYIEEDRRLLEAVRPDLVVGDFRLSLAVSARLAGVRYAALANAHWSPYSTASFPLPDLPINDRLGLRVARLVFRLARPLAFALQARPLNRLRRSHGLPALGDLRHVYTYGDETLYLDTPGMAPTVGLPPNHRYLGPVIWSPETAAPQWWEALPADRPCIYVTPGSSGRADLLPEMLAELARLPVSVLVATAGRSDPGALPENVWAAEYLPGTLAAQRSALVICNGGSATVYQALNEGVPVLGIASNLDQFLTMGAVERRGAGVTLRAGRASGRAVRQAAAQILNDPHARSAAQSVAAEFARFDAAGRFRAFVAGREVHA